MSFEPHGRWWRGANLDLDSVRGHLRPPSRVTLMDATLREGEEAAGTFLTPDLKLRLAHALQEAGLTELEIGYCGVIDEHYELAKNLKRSGITAKLASHTRCYARTGEWEAEIDRTIEAGCDILTFVAFGSQAMLRTTPWLALEALPDRIAACVERCRRQGAVATFSLAGSDLFRTPLERIARCYAAAAQAGAARLYVSDGTGGATPEAISFLAQFLRHAAPGPAIALHLHNTFGLATANALAGVMHGAAAVDCTLLGMGDGAGITALEEIALALEVLYGVETGVRLDQITALCRLAHECFGTALSPHKPHVGENIFRHQIDSHIAAILRGDWSAWEVVRAEALGRERRLEFGYGKLRRGRSGAIALLVERLGLIATDTQMDEILDRIRAVTVRQRVCSLSEAEQIIRAVLAGEGGAAVG